MRILVTGGAGFVGRRVAECLAEHGHEVVAAYHRNDPVLSTVNAHQVDVTNKSEVQRLLGEISPDAVVHAAALVDADQCETDQNHAWHTNVEGTKNIVQGAERNGSMVLFVSSSFVFSGRCDQYTEADTRDPINVYGKTKVAAENVVEQATVPSAIVRIDQPYGVSTDWQTSSMVEWVLDELASQSGAVEVFSDWSNNPIYNRDIAACICLLLEDELQGIYHLVGPEHISRYRWARRIAAVFDYDVNRIQRVKSADAGLAAERPNANLSITKLVAQTGYVPSGTYDGLQKIVEERVAE